MPRKSLKKRLSLAKLVENSKTGGDDAEEEDVFRRSESDLRASVKRDKFGRRKSLGIGNSFRAIGNSFRKLSDKNRTTSLTVENGMK